MRSAKTNGDFNQITIKTAAESGGFAPRSERDENFLLLGNFHSTNYIAFELIMNYQVRHMTRLSLASWVLSASATKRCGAILPLIFLVWGAVYWALS